MVTFFWGHFLQVHFVATNPTNHPPTHPTTHSPLKWYNYEGVAHLAEEEERHKQAFYESLLPIMESKLTMQKCTLRRNIQKII